MGLALTNKFRLNSVTLSCLKSSPYDYSMSVISSSIKNSLCKHGKSTLFINQTQRSNNKNKSGDESITYQEGLLLLKLHGKWLKDQITANYDMDTHDPNSTDIAVCYLSSKNTSKLILSVLGCITENYIPIMLNSRWSSQEIVTALLPQTKSSFCDKKMYYTFILYDNEVDTQNANRAVTILQDCNDHVAFALPIPNIIQSSIDTTDVEMTSNRQKNKVNSNETAIIIFTSGTTSGINKGVRISSRSLLIQSKAKTTNPCNYNKNTNMIGSICIPPLFHIGGISSILGVILVGGCLVFPYSKQSSFDSRVITSCLSHSFQKSCRSKEEYVNTLVVVPAMLHSLMEQNQENAISYPYIKLILVGGQSMIMKQRIKARKIFPNAKFVQTYACTEAGSSITFAELSDSSYHDDTNGSYGDYVGIPPPHIQIKIVPTDDTNNNSKEKVGIIATRGIHIMNGYWKRGDAKYNDINLSPNDWLVTSDLGYIIHSKYDTSKLLLYFCGRKHDVIRTGGETVFALEIESVLLKMRDIESCAVFALPDERLGEIVSCAIALSSSSKIGINTQMLSRNDNNTYNYVMADHALTSKIRKHCKDNQLSGYKHPRLIFIFDKLPSNSSGKLLKHKLKDLLRDHSHQKSKL